MGMETDLQTVEGLALAFKRFHRKKMEIENPSMEQKMSEGWILMLLFDVENESEQGLKVSEISRHMCVTAPFVTQLLNTLEEKQLIKRFHDQEDRRIVRITLTDEGRENAKGVKKSFIKRFSALVEHLGEDDSRKLSELLNKTFDFIEQQKHTS